MTSVSTALAFGFMPLNLYIYSHSWAGSSAGFKSPANTIPYKNILITLVSILVPVAIGILIRKKWPKVANVLAKVCYIFHIMQRLFILSM